MSGQTEIKQSKQSFSLLYNLRDFVLIISIYLYFIGWIYIYNYLKYFGISINDAQLDFYALFIYSFSVIINSFTDPDLRILLLIFTAWYIFLYKHPGHFREYVNAKLLFILFFFMSFYISSIVGITQAKTQENSSTTRLKSIKFIFNKDFYADSLRFSKIIAAEDSAFLKVNDEGLLKLIISNEDKYFVIYKDSIYNQIIYAIPKEHTRFAKIE